MDSKYKAGYCYCDTFFGCSRHSHRTEKKMHFVSMGFECPFIVEFNLNVRREMHSVFCFFNTFTSIFHSRLISLRTIPSIPNRTSLGRIGILIN